MKRLKLFFRSRFYPTVSLIALGVFLNACQKEDVAPIPVDSSLSALSKTYYLKDVSGLNSAKVVITAKSEAELNSISKVELLAGIIESSPIPQDQLNNIGANKSEDINFGLLKEDDGLKVEITDQKTVSPDVLLSVKVLSGASENATTLKSIVSRRYYASGVYGIEMITKKPVSYKYDWHGPWYENGKSYSSYNWYSGWINTPSTAYSQLHYLSDMVSRSWGLDLSIEHTLLNTPWIYAAWVVKNGGSYYRSTIPGIFGPGGPVGNFEGVSNYVITGWTYDLTYPATSIWVHIYIDGPAGSGTYIGACQANIPRSDVNNAFGITGNHGFSFAIPAQYRSGHRNFWVHGINATSGQPNPVIGGSPKGF